MVTSADRTTFHWRVHTLCSERHMTLVQLATAMGTTPSGLANTLKLSNPRLDTLCRMADALGVSLDYLAGREGQEDAP